MKRLFITGETGFVGRTFQCMATDMARQHGWQWIPAPLKYDLRDPASLLRVLREIRPDGVIHLAGQSFVPASLQDPAHTLQVNLVGTANLLQALKETGFQGRFLYVSSGDVYGQVAEDHLPIPETLPTRPQNPYALSKAAAETLCLQWSRSEAWRIVVARPFNHIGPGQRTEFVMPSFARQIARIRAGLDAPRIAVGEIDVTRDFLDVRDLARAYLGLLDEGQDGTSYNVCSGHEVSIRSLLEHLCQLAGVRPEIVRDPARLRPADQHRVRGDNRRLREATGWEPQIPVSQSLQDILDEQIRQLSAEPATAPGFEPAPAVGPTLLRRASS